MSHFSALPAIIQTARDLAMFAATIYLVVLCRPIVSAAKTFFDRALQHFAFMETKADLVASNHLSHIQKSLETLVENGKK